MTQFAKAKGLASTNSEKNSLKPHCMCCWHCHMPRTPSGYRCFKDYYWFLFDHEIQKKTNFFITQCLTSSIRLLRQMLLFLSLIKQIEKTIERKCHTPSFSLSIRTFFSATTSPVAFSRAIYTCLHVQGDRNVSLAHDKKIGLNDLAQKMGHHNINIHSQRLIDR